MDSDNDIDVDDNIPILKRPTQTRVMPKRRSKLSASKLTGFGLWTRW